ncbi:MAG TPA: hypothetical protein PK175_00425 [Syntrophales bacterium]|jgi:hypothetical protein|nr:hypothetical protein [Syntrophales bacterium]HON23215.1 hypothetical protein [Syntrophales bacterium]HOU76659.1 hypothetical protein [Syntrophales bacterium]HPC31416.1 hypothetical protein [Syntrophales bacterium]HQG33322.1 hypothetical protein [Syntrophales bacterium]
MLMMTHTWLLDRFLRERHLREEDLDLFIYNICPDLLPLHKGITAAETHGISRAAPLPPPHRKNAFVYFHLMVDDLSHHGMITGEPIREFNPDANGYTYLKGKPLVEPLLDIYAAQGTPIPYAQAAYRSHMVIEMTFDLAMHGAEHAEGERLIALLCDAMRFTVEEKLAEFSENIGWLYGIMPAAVAETMREGAAFYNRERIGRFMTLEGRIQLFAGKFGISREDVRALAMLEDIMKRGLELVRDYNDFMKPTLAEIVRTGFAPDY